MSKRQERVINGEAHRLVKIQPSAAKVGDLLIDGHPFHSETALVHSVDTDREAHFTYMCLTTTGYGGLGELRLLTARPVEIYRRGCGLPPAGFSYAEELLVGQETELGIVDAVLPGRNDAIIHLEVRVPQESPGHGFTRQVETNRRAPVKITPRDARDVPFTDGSPDTARREAKHDNFSFTAPNYRFRQVLRRAAEIQAGDVIEGVGTVARNATGFTTGRHALRLERALNADGLPPALVANADYALKVTTTSAPQPHDVAIPAEERSPTENEVLGRTLTYVTELERVARKRAADDASGKNYQQAAIHHSKATAFAKVNAHLHQRIGS